MDLDEKGGSLAEGFLLMPVSVGLDNSLSIAVMLLFVVFLLMFQNSFDNRIVTSMTCHVGSISQFIFLSVPFVSLAWLS